MKTERPLPRGVVADVERLSRTLADFSREDVLGLIYEYRIGRVFSSIAVVEDAMVQALWACRNVHLVGQPEDASPVEGIVWRRSVLQDQTFGNLIQILSRNGLSDPSLNYFRFLKRLRDRFIHRFFEDHVFPGEMREGYFTSHMRDLRCFELVFWRATNRIWHILGHEKYDRVTDLGDHGLLLWNNLEDEFPDSGAGG